MEERFDGECDISGAQIGRQVGVVALQTSHAVVEAEIGDPLAAHRRLSGAQSDARSADGEPLREIAEAGTDSAAEVDDVHGRRPDDAHRR